MITTYEAAVKWMDEHLSQAIKPGLQRVEHLLEQLNHPEKKIKGVHISGTNGKGSTLHFLQKMLMEHGFSVGSFTSPYFDKWNEQISVNEIEIKDEQFLYHFNKLIPFINRMIKEGMTPSAFEVITVLAFDYFASQNLDYCLIETGLGGRLDSTNVFTPLLTIITNVSFDHMSFLGNSIEEITFEKAGIMKPNVPLITGITDPKAKRIIEEKAKSLQCDVYYFNQQFAIDEGEHHTFTFHSNSVKITNLSLNMLGNHQMTNASIAIQALLQLRKMEFFALEERKIRKALIQGNWPGRMEIIKEHPDIILDGAHNVSGMQALLQALETYYPSKKKHLILSIMKDKEWEKMISLIDHKFDAVYFTHFEKERAADGRLLYNKSNDPNKYFASNWKDAYQQLAATIDEDEEIIVFSGSLYFIFHVRSYFLGEKD